MATEGTQLKLTGLAAGADLSTTGQYRFVKLSADKTVIRCAAATDVPIGVLQNNPESGDAAEVCWAGETKIEGDADLDFGQIIGTSADGQADRKIHGTDVTEYACGRVLRGNSAAGGMITAVINCATPAPAVTAN